MIEPEETTEHAETVQFLCAAAKRESSLVERLEKTLEISQDSEWTGSPASEETESREEAVQEEATKQDVLSVGSPVPETCTTSDTKWEAGSQCLAVYSEDGQIYPATVVCLDGKRCRVRFNGYDNEEDVELSTLQSPQEAPPTQTSQKWRPGSRCRAVYSEDGLVYPAMVLWVKGQRCRVRFENYNNEEDVDVLSLLSRDELHGPNRTRGKGIMWKKRGRKEENLGGGAAERRSTLGEEQLSFSVKNRTTNQMTAEQDDAQTPTNRSFPLFPPFPPPAQPSSMESLSFIPPPPPSPLWPFGGKEAADSASSMLMLWYTCGFHTGSYMTQQKFRSTSED